jgi:hypothetical protein
MKTFQEWLAMREGLWLNDKNAVIGLSRLNPLPKDSAVNKSLAKGPAKAKARAMSGISHEFDNSINRSTIHLSKD